MPTPSRKTPQRIARVLELYKRGMSAREIADEIGVAHVTVQRWLKASGLKPNGGKGPRVDRVPREPERTEQVIASARQELAELESAPVPPTDRAGAIAHLSMRLGQVAFLTQTFARRARDGTASISDVDKSIKLEQSLATQIVQLSPQEAPDPESDPTNLEAASAVRREMASLVEQAERNVRCVHCGKPPFAAEHAVAVGGAR